MAWWFGKKKGQKENLKVLNEEEIQRKLYGEVRTIPKPYVPPRTSEPSSLATFSPSPSKGRLFEEPPPGERGGIVVEEPQQKEPRRTESWVAETPVPTMGTKVWDGVRTVMAGILGTLLSIDFRHPRVRRIFYWGGACVFLGALFFGIHALNVKREAAMNNSMGIIRQTPAPAPEAAPREDPSEVEALEEVLMSVEETSQDQDAEVQEAFDSVQQPIKEFPFVIQVATYATERDALRVAKRLRLDNAEGFVRSLSRSSGRVYYVVFIGRFKALQDAEVVLKEFQGKKMSEPFGDAFIRRLNK